MKFWLRLAVFFILFCFNSFAAETFRVATYNVENYLDQPTESRLHIKSDEAKAKIRESIKVMNPDVIALEEMGITNALLELRASLKADGLDFPFWEHIPGIRHKTFTCTVLSKLPIVARHPHTNEFFLLDGTEEFPGKAVALRKWTSQCNDQFHLHPHRPRSGNHGSTRPKPMKPRNDSARQKSCAASLTHISKQTRMQN